MIRRSRLVGALLVALVAVAAVGPASDGGFVYDDEPYVVQNQAVSGEASVLQSPLGDPRQGLWRPLTVASYRLQWAGPHDARPLLRGNVLLHVIVSLLVMGLGRRLGLGSTPATVAGLLFAVHPVHAEAVAWVTGRSELLATTCVLAGWLAHLSARRAAPALAVLAVICAGLSKENALIAPALYIAGDLALRRRPNWGRWALLGGASVAVFAARLVALPQLFPADGPYMSSPLGGRVVVALNVIGKAFQLLAWPHPLRIEYQRDEFVLGRPDTLVVAALAMGLVLWLWRRDRIAALGLGLVPLALGPVLHLVPIGEPFAERFLYLPSVGLCLAAGALLAAWSRHELRTGLGLGPSLGAAVLALGLGLVTCRAAVRVFQDDLTLWAHAARVAPDLALTRYNHGAFLDRAGRHVAEDRDRPGCVDELTASLDLEPRHVYAGFAHQMLGTHALGAVGDGLPDPWRAARHFREAIELLPGLADARINLAGIAVSAPDVVGPGEALLALAPLRGGASVDAEYRVAAEELARQLSSPAPSSEEATGTSSPDGS